MNNFIENKNSSTEEKRDVMISFKTTLAEKKKSKKC